MHIPTLVILSQLALQRRRRGAGVPRGALGVAEGDGEHAAEGPDAGDFGGLVGDEVDEGTGPGGPDLGVVDGAGRLGGGW